MDISKSQSRRIKRAAMLLRKNSQLTYLEERRLLLVGKTGVGKSSTGNTILGKKPFKSAISGAAVTRQCSFEVGEHSGKKLVVVDCPGFCDRDLSDETVQEEITKALTILSPGFHAVIFVVSAGRFASDDEKTIELYKNIFGDKMYRNTIIVLTRWDEVLEGGEYTTPEKYLATCGDVMKTHMSDCGNRVIAFNNKASEEERTSQVGGLLDVVEQLAIANEEEYFEHYIFKTLEKAINLMAKEMVSSFSDVAHRIMIQQRVLGSISSKRKSSSSKKEESFKSTERREVESASDALDEVLNVSDDVIQEENEMIDRDALRRKMLDPNEKSFAGIAKAFRWLVSGSKQTPPSEAT